jgi:hypothetical protein
VTQQQLKQEQQLQERWNQRELSVGKLKEPQLQHSTPHSRQARATLV